jgi:hypothetical protein
MDDIAGGAREDRGLCCRWETLVGGSGERTGDAEDARAPKLGADRLWRSEGSGGDDVLWLWTPSDGLTGAAALADVTAGAGCVDRAELLLVSLGD